MKKTKSNIWIWIILVILVLIFFKYLIAFALLGIIILAFIPNTKRYLEERFKFKLTLPIQIIVSVFCTILIFILLFSGGGTKAVTCNKPYILVGTDCCLDQNNNSICDKDENIQELEDEKEGIQQTGSSEEKTSEEPIKLTVSRVVDGDTFVLNTEDKVRLIGIDTPETDEDYYKEATDRLTKLVLGKEVTLEKDISETDKYGRLLRYVYVDGKFINEIMVEEGWAEAYPYEPDTKYKTEFASAETEAKNKNLGVWQVGEIVEEEEETEEQTEQEETQTGDSDCTSLGCDESTKYVGSKESDKYHYCDCRWAKKILEENLICFKSKEEAISKGYVACGVCKP